MKSHQPELRNIPLTFMDCPDIGQLFKEQCYFDHNIYGGTCKIKREFGGCPRGFAS